MLSTITLKRPQNKDEECKLLEDIAELVQGNDTYLAELFTPGMVNDIQGRMRNDFPCNLYQDFRDQAAEADSKMDLANSLKRDYVTLDNAATAAAIKTNEIIAEMQSKIDYWAKRFNEINDNFSEFMTEANKVQSALSNREMEICQLKAKLYDLEHK
jgi:hypothetical protein